MKSTLCIATSTHYIVQSPSSAAAQVVVLAGTVLLGRRVEWEKCSQLNGVLLTLTRATLEELNWKKNRFLFERVQF